MTFAREAFTDYKLLDIPIQVNTASGAGIQAIATGNVALKVALWSTVRDVTLIDVLHVIAGSLISVTQLQDNGITMRTTPGSQGELLIEHQGTLLGVARPLNIPRSRSKAVKLKYRACS